MYLPKMNYLSRLLSIFILIFPVTNGFSQRNWHYNGYFNFGCNINFTYGPSQHFPGARVFAAFIANGVYKKSFTINYGPSVSVYTKSLGANLNPLVGDIQVDFTNSFTIGAAWGGNLSYTKFFKTFNTGSFYNLASSKKYGAYLTSNFVLNNHRRNQITGAVSLSTPHVSINYYNDGAPPFNLLPLADNFDRWWTGGFGIYVHNRKNFNAVELSFDQFTGYTPLMHELSNLIGINLPDYSVEDSVKNNKRGMLPAAFNTSAYNLKVFTMPGFAIDAGVLGSLRTKDGRVFGLQDIIHTMLRYPLHPNNDVNRFYIGGTYINMNHVKL